MLTFLCRAVIFALTLNAAGVARAEGVWREFPAGEITLRAFVFTPDTPAPHPAIVALHGCAGLMNPDGSENSRHAEWARRLRDAGFMVVFPESFASRGMGPQCLERERQVLPRHRANDALATLRWLKAQTGIRGDAIGLLGWSHGGSTVLNTASVARKPQGGDFRLAVAFYPGCRVYAESGRYDTRFPVTILHGLADNWTPAEPCRALKGTRFVGYEGAHHSFDHPNLPTRRRRAAFTPDGSGWVTIGTHKEAREAAIAEAMRVFGALK